MTATSQHEIHPDAEHLNAFAEQALSERERGEVLGHLAVCDRCRQVVALAREAAVAETAVGVVATAGKSKGQPRRVWWKEWRLALAPVAALAMTAVVVSYVYERRVERPAQMAQSTPPAALKSEEPPAIPDQAEVPAPPPPASPAAGIEKNKQKAEGSGAAARQHAPEMASPAKPPAPAAMDRSAEEAQMQAAPPRPAEAPGFAGGALPAAAQPSANQPSVEAEWQAEKKERDRERLQADSGAEPERRFAAKPAPQVPQGGGGAQASSEQVQVTAAAPELETRSAPMTGFGTLGGSSAGGLFAVNRLSAIHLPSGLAAMSFTAAGARMLAIDKAGTLYLSEDSGITWESVTRQWTGRAVLVRRQAAQKANADHALKAKRAENAPAGSGGTPPPAPVFEIVNDKSQVWISTDGTTWTAQ